MEAGVGIEPASTALQAVDSRANSRSPSMPLRLRHAHRSLNRNGIPPATLRAHRDAARNREPGITEIVVHAVKGQPPTSHTSASSFMTGARGETHFCR